MPFFFVAGCVLLDNSAIFLYLYEKSDPLVSGEKTLTMKKWCVWLLALCVSQGAAAQDSEAGECVFHTGLEQYPTFMGGDLTEFRAWVYRNIRYPREAFDRGEQGRILVSFVIDTLGNVTQVEPSLYGIRSSFFVFSSGLIPELLAELNGSLLFSACRLPCSGRLSSGRGISPGGCRRKASRRRPC